jgi:hypothetical protein
VRGRLATNPLWRKALARWQARANGVRARGNQEIVYRLFDFRAIGVRPSLGRAAPPVTMAARDNLPFLAQISGCKRSRQQRRLVRAIDRQDDTRRMPSISSCAGPNRWSIVRLLALKRGRSDGNYCPPRPGKAGILEERMPACART